MTIDEERHARIAAVEAEFGEPLTADDVAMLPEGARVLVIWSGGNGPHEYLIAGDQYSTDRYAESVRPDWDEATRARMRYYNPLTFVGGQRFHTRVWRVIEGGSGE
jgi:hypothetical protein